MRETLLIKHTVSGRFFFDTKKSAVPYTIERSEEGWLFKIETAWSENVEELLRRKEELNLFIFKEYDDQPTLKTWYYVKDGPVEYNRDLGLLMIHAGSHIDYYPHEFLH